MECILCHQRSKSYKLQGEESMWASNTVKGDADPEKEKKGV